MHTFALNFKRMNMCVLVGWWVQTLFGVLNGGESSAALTLASISSKISVLLWNKALQEKHSEKPGHYCTYRNYRTPMWKTHWTWGSWILWPSCYLNAHAECVAWCEKQVLLDFVCKLLCVLPNSEWNLWHWIQHDIAQRSLTEEKSNVKMCDIKELRPSWPIPTTQISTSYCITLYKIKYKLKNTTQNFYLILSQTLLSEVLITNSLITHHTTRRFFREIQTGFRNLMTQLKIKQTTAYW